MYDECTVVVICIGYITNFFYVIRAKGFLLFYFVDQ